MDTRLIWTLRYVLYVPGSIVFLPPRTIEAKALQVIDSQRQTIKKLFCN